MVFFRGCDELAVDFGPFKSRVIWKPLLHFTISRSLGLRYSRFCCVSLPVLASLGFQSRFERCEGFTSDSSLFLFRLSLHGDSNHNVSPDASPNDVDLPVILISRDLARRWGIENTWGYHAET
jgi:hypothetical protein